MLFPQSPIVFLGNEVAGVDYNQGGGLYATGRVGLNLSNCIFIANRATGGNYNHGGGAFVEFPATIINCTFVKNSISPDSWSTPGGGGIYFNGTQSTTMTNSILWDNYQESTDNHDQITQGGGFGLPFISYSNIDQDGFESGNGNIRLDPLFINPNDDDYHLQPSSPCIDVGDPTSDYSNEPDPNGCRINLGAFGNTTEATTSPDSDFDGIYSDCDNCPEDNNPNQEDYDVDGVGDVCDNCPEVRNEGQADTDGDGLGDMCDECTDTDGDGYGNPGFPSNTCPLDNCPDIYNISQADFDEDDFGNVCDQCPYDFVNDIDGDGICGDVDNCSAIANPGQEDYDGDEIGDVCDECTDKDGDGYGNPGFPFNTCDDDNCPTVANPDQTDSDSDGRGDFCDDTPYFPDLRPTADGHYYDVQFCDTYAGFCRNDGSSVGDEIIVSYEVLGMWPYFWYEHTKVGIMEFDISSIDGLFTSGNIEAYLTVTIKEGNLPDDTCLSLYDIQVINENGIIEKVDVETGDFAGGICGDLQYGDSITFDVTSAVEHDLFDPEQTDFSGFILRSSDWVGGISLGAWEDWIALFYDHTNPMYGPRLSISAIDLDGDGIRDDEDNCYEIPNGPDLGTCFSWSGMASGTTCLSDADCGGLAGSCSKNQEDVDGDCIGDVCDDFPEIYDPTQPDSDSDGVGDVCDTDDDNDSVLDVNDNCPLVANTSQEDGDTDSIGDACDNCPETPNPTQLDTYPPQGNDIGDACDCESDFNCNGNVDANDVTSFLTDFGRSIFHYTCTNADPCNGDFNCDTNVAADDVTKFLEDFGRSQFFNPCPACVAEAWCVYP